MPAPQRAVVHAGKSRAGAKADVGREAACVWKVEIGVGEEMMTCHAPNALLGAGQFRTEHLGVGRARRSEYGRGLILVRGTIEILHLQAYMPPESPANRNAAIMPKALSNLLCQSSTAPLPRFVAVQPSSAQYCGLTNSSQRLALSIVAGAQSEAVRNVDAERASYIKTGVGVGRRPAQTNGLYAGKQQPCPMAPHDGIVQGERLCATVTGAQPAVLVSVFQQAKEPAAMACGVKGGVSGRV